jgi:hypothetical protein
VRALGLGQQRVDLAQALAPPPPPPAPAASERARSSTSPRPISSGSSTSARATAAGAPSARAPSASAARSRRSTATRSASAASVVEPGEQRAHEADVAHVELEVAHAQLAQQPDGQPQHLHVRLGGSVADQLGAELEGLARVAAPVGALAVDLPGVGEPQRLVPVAPRAGWPPSARWRR